MIDFSTPLAGMQRASAQVSQAAANIAVSGFTPPTDRVDLSSDMVALMQGQNDFAANTKVVQTEDQMSQSLRNIVG